MISFSHLGQNGRLGNQLFQVAATIAAARRFGTNALFPHWEYARYFQGSFDQSLRPEQIKNTYVEPSFRYAPIPNIPDLDLDGLFQSAKHFADCLDYVRAQFRFVDGIVPQEMMPLPNDCSIHVRRGDYLKKPHYHTNLGMDYYIPAIERMRAKGATRFVVFSDDISSCKTAFPADCLFVEDLDEIQSLCYMSRFQNHIIANSSYSWWGAWLSNPAPGAVVAPKNWFGLAYKVTGTMKTDDLYLPDWTVLDSKPVDCLDVVKALVGDVREKPLRYKRIVLGRPQERYWY